MKKQSLTPEEFDRLVRLEEQRRGIRQNATEFLPANSPHLGETQPQNPAQVENNLAEWGLVADGQITPAGLEALAPYRVRRGIIVAAGMGERLHPLTLTIPKPLVPVHGVPMIETLLQAMEEAEIPEVVVVRGHLWEQFDVLRENFPQIRFMENHLYHQHNNISSLYLVRDLLQNAYIMEGDLVLKNPRLITKYQYCTNYLATPVAKTPEWGFKTRGDLITETWIGGEDLDMFVGISHWSAEDGEKLGAYLEEMYMAQGVNQIFWDEIALQYEKESFAVYVRRCQGADVVEIDHFHELQAMDERYR